MRVDWVGVRVRWGMYGVRVYVAANARMIPLPILFCHRGRGCRQQRFYVTPVSSFSSFFSSLLVLSAKLIIKSMLLLSMMLLMES